MGQQSRSSGASNTSKRAAKDERMAATRQRIAAEREAQRKAEKRRTVMFGVVGTVVAAAVVAGLSFIVMSGDDDKKNGDLAGNALVAEVKPAEGKTSPIAGVTVYTASQGHKPGQPIKYNEKAPVGGEHDPAWQNCGIYDKPVEDRNGVHSLEHGAVWITYKPGLPADQLEKLKAKVKGKTYMMLSPYEGLGNPVQATAWGLQLKLDNADDPRLDAFIAAYREGPQTPEPGAACSGGVGKPTA
jgi:hypothetical protein